MRSGQHSVSINNMHETIYARDFEFFLPGVIKAADSTPTGPWIVHGPVNTCLEDLERDLTEKSDLWKGLETFKKYGMPVDWEHQYLRGNPPRNVERIIGKGIRIEDRDGLPDLFAQLRKDKADAQQAWKHLNPIDPTDLPGELGWSYQGKAQVTVNPDGSRKLRPDIIMVSLTPLPVDYRSRVGIVQVAKSLTEAAAGGDLDEWDVMQKALGSGAENQPFVDLEQAERLVRKHYGIPADKAFTTGEGVVQPEDTGGRVDRKQDLRGVKDAGPGEGGDAKKSQGAVNYRDGEGDKTCGACEYFSDGACSKVEGKIEASMLCDLFEAKSENTEKSIQWTRHDYGEGVVEHRGSHGKGLYRIGKDEHGNGWHALHSPIAINRASENLGWHAKLSEAKAAVRHHHETLGVGDGSVMAAKSVSHREARRQARMVDKARGPYTDADEEGQHAKIYGKWHRNAGHGVMIPSTGPGDDSPEHHWGDHQQISPMHAYNGCNHCHAGLRHTTAEHERQIADPTFRVGKSTRATQIATAARGMNDVMITVQKAADWSGLDWKPTKYHSGNTFHHEAQTSHGTYSITGGPTNGGSRYTATYQQHGKSGVVPLSHPGGTSFPDVDMAKLAASSHDRGVSVTSKSHVGFDRLQSEIQSKEGFTADRAARIASAIGRKKYGKRRMARMATRGRKAAA